MSDESRPDVPSTPELARWLRALASEVERDPDLAARIAGASSAADEQVAPSLTPPTSEIPPEIPPPDEAAEPPIDIVPPALRHGRRSSRYGPPTVAGRPAHLGQGIPDPFALFASMGEDGLRQTLGELRAGTLRAIIREHHLDPQNKILTNATEKRLVTAIVTAVMHKSGVTKPRSPAKARKPR